VTRRKKFQKIGARNFSIDGATPKGVESVVISTIFKPLVTRLVDKLTWLRSAENVAIYTDVRGLLNFVRINHGNVFRRTILCAMIDSTKNIIKTQCKVEPRDPTK
jgi:hypothetical protein